MTNTVSTVDLWESFDYDPLNGKLIRKATSNGRKPRTPFAHKVNGYLAFGIKGNCCYEHRLVWQWITGTEPELHIDHKDRNRTNNRFCNLRQLPDSLNRWTTTKPGYYWREDRQCFMARVSNLEGRKLCLYTTSEKEAQEWVLQTREKIIAEGLNRGELSCRRSDNGVAGRYR